jgi:hypothetical protein
VRFASLAYAEPFVRAVRGARQDLVDPNQALDSFSVDYDRGYLKTCAAARQTL